MESVQNERGAAAAQGIIAGQQASSDNNGITTTYVLNTSSHKFHKPDCSTVKKMKETNKKIVTESRTQLLSEGYTPCKICNP